MTHCVEPFIQDLVWCWVDRHPEYTKVGGEVTIGSGVNSGRVDLVAETTSGEFHGFEIKNCDFSYEQLNRYSEAGCLDRLYHCSRVGEDFAERLSDGQEFQKGTYESRQIRKDISNGIAAGQYTEEDYKSALRDTFSDAVLDSKATVGSEVNKRVLGESEKTIEALLTRNIGIPTADFDPNKTYISLDEAIKKIQKNQAMPTEIGLIDVPFSYEKSGEEDGYREHLNASVEEMFAKNKREDVELIRQPEQLDREHTPTLSQTNEAWIQHYTWESQGTIREAVIPHAADGKEYLIDIMGFEGGHTPTEIYQAGENAKLIGIEAKGDIAFTGSEEIESIREQLCKYRNSGVLTHLYLAVPSQNRSEGEAVLDVAALSDIGLLTVSRGGVVETVWEPERMSMQYDGYIKHSAGNQYPRSIGFGSIYPADESEFASPCNV